MCALEAAAGLNVRPRHGIHVSYDGIRVGEFFADVLGEGCVILALIAIGLTVRLFRSFSDLSQGNIAINYKDGHGAGYSIN